MTKNNQQPIVTLIGRTNVGKSTLFNKLTGRQKAITSKIPGTTRDVKQGQCLWIGQTFILQDTAGLDVSTEKLIDREAIKLAQKAAKKSDLLLFVVDAKDGLLPQDKEYAKLIKKLNKPYILVANKVDSNKQMNLLAEFQKLGLDEPIAVSAATGAGTGDLLDAVLEKIKNKFPEIQISEKLPTIKIALVGKPNVGKSSLLNKLCGEEKVVVSELPHTTRDSQDVSLEFLHNQKKYNLTFIDTAGITKQNKTRGAIEKTSIRQSLNNIKKADIVLLILDATKPVTAQDKNISREILDNSKSLIFVVNKWDLVEDKTTKSAQQFTKFVNMSFPYLTWAPIVFLSAKTGEKVKNLIKKIFELHDKQHLQITQTQLNNFLKYILKKQPPRKTKGTKPPYIHMITQIKTSPQTFEIICDQPFNIHFSYLRFISNQLRKRYDLEGVGIKLTTRLPRKK